MMLGKKSQYSAIIAGRNALIIAILVCVVLDAAIAGACLCSILHSHCRASKSGHQPEVFTGSHSNRTSVSGLKQNNSKNDTTADLLKNIFCLLTLLIPTLVIACLVHSLCLIYKVHSSLKKIVKHPLMREILPPSAQNSTDKKYWVFLTDLIKRTWRYPNQAGHDAWNLKNSSLTPRHVLVVNNHVLWKRYIASFKEVRFSDEHSVLPRNLLFEQYHVGAPTGQCGTTETEQPETGPGIHKQLPVQQNQDPDPGKNINTKCDHHGDRVCDPDEDPTFTHPPNCLIQSTNSDILDEVRSNHGVAGYPSCHVGLGQKTDGHTSRENWPISDSSEPVCNGESRSGKQNEINLEQAQEVNVPIQSSLELKRGEFFLLHGTKIKNVPSIIKDGFQIEKSRADALYGRGMYFTDSSQKADQYADDSQRRRESCLAIIVVRVLLGRVGAYDEGNTEQHMSLDTVVAGNGKRFLEYVKSESSHCYPAFVIIYDRSTGQWDPV